MTSGEALRSAEGIAPESVPSLERRSRLFLDIAVGHRQRNEEAAAVHYLSVAHQTSPEAVRYVPMARSVARDLALSASGPLKADAVALADEIGVQAA